MSLWGIDRLGQYDDYSDEELQFQLPILLVIDILLSCFGDNVFDRYTGGEVR